MRRPVREVKVRRARRKLDRVTLGLAALAAGTAGTVLGGHVIRMARRRLRDAPEQEPSVIGATGQATLDSAAVLSEGYSEVTRGERVLFNLLSGFVGAFATVRLSTMGIRSGWWPFGNVRVRGRHIHHFVPGILLAFTSGGAALLTANEHHEELLALPFGVGAGLTFDEAALLLDLEDVYWSPQGLLSVQISLAASAILGATILGLRILQRGEQRAEAQDLIPESG